MGCLFRLGCLVVLLICGVVAYFARDLWMDRLPWRPAQNEVARDGQSGATDRSSPGPTGTAASRTTNWAPLSQSGANRTRDALQRLSGPRGPVFVTLDGSDVASYIFLQLARQMPAATDSFAARVVDDRVQLRARMRTSDLGGAVGGALGAVLGERERVELSGRLRVVGPGLAAFQVEDMRIRDINLPDAVVSRLMKTIARAPQAAGLDENALPISIPSYIGDVRVSNGRITLYKNVQ